MSLGPEETGFATAGNWLVITGIVGTILAQRERNRHAARRWSRWCAALGWTYFGSRFDPPVDLIQDRKHEVRHAVRGRIADVDAAAWNARPTSFGKQYHVVQVAMPAVSPGLTVRLRRLKHRASRQSVKLESHGFADLLHVESADPRFAHDVLHPRAMELVLGAGAELIWTWKGKWLLVAREGGLSPDDALDLFPLAMAFRDLVPTFLESPLAATPVPAP